MNTPSVNDLLKRGVAEVLPDADALKKKLSSGKKLRVKLGIDPTGADLHLGHAVPLRKLRQFQDAGHTAVLIIGDTTAQIGDPSGKDVTRTALSADDVRRNSETYLAQAHLVLAKRNLEVHRQSAWFAQFGLEDVIALAAQVTVPQLLAHDTFRQRLSRGTPFSAHELLYPLLQGFDSVAVHADIELGAVEQKFNILMGREVQKAYQQTPQSVLLVPYLLGTDGKEKMSKSLGNTIALRDTANDMYGKAMSIPDSQIKQWFELATTCATTDVTAALKLANPRDRKMRLAKEIVMLYHGSPAATAAEQYFVQTFHEGVIDPNQIPAVSVTERQPLTELLVTTGLAVTKSDARRAIEQGGVKVDGKVAKDWKQVVMPKPGMILQRGKKSFRRVV